MDETKSMIGPLPERRGKSRTSCNYPAVVKGRDAIGESFAENARIVNISPSGAFMYIYRPIMVKTRLSMAITVTDLSQNSASNHVATYGTVIRCSMYPSGVYGVAVKFP